jgi:26S proteasome regulatory subunit N2
LPQWGEPTSYLIPWVAGLRSQCPRVVALLAESYNPHMRYGAAMAVGIALLEPLTIDAVDYVRQGALIAMAMVLVQQTEAPRVAAFRKQVC